MLDAITPEILVVLLGQRGENLGSALLVRWRLTSYSRVHELAAKMNVCKGI